MSLADQRNKVGLTVLRGRYVRRAEYLIGNADYQRQIESARERWNKRYPEFWINSPVAAPNDLKLPESRKLFTPESLEQELRYQEELRERKLHAEGYDSTSYWEITEAWGAWFQEFVEELCLQAFPSRFFFDTGFTIFHPASAFISACLIYDPRTLSSSTKRLFPIMRLGPKAAPFPPASPHEKLEGLAAQGERDFYRETLLRLLADKPEEFEQIVTEATRVGLVHARKIQPYGWFPPYEDWWHYFPIFPQMSTADIDDARSEIVARSLQLFGAQPINDHIRSLKTEGWTNRHIADLLGVHIDTVNTVVRGMATNDQLKD